MVEFFKIVLVLSLTGFCITGVLLILKPVIFGKLPAKWQYLIWLTALFSMIVPLYKFIPEKEARKLPVYTEPLFFRYEIPELNEAEQEEVTQYNTVNESPMPKENTNWVEVLAYIWLAGAILYIAVVGVSYIIYLNKKRKNSVPATDPQFDEVIKKLKIKRKIRLRISDDKGSPMLVGLIFPVVYIPEKDIGDIKMVYIHELTHYKRKDLFVKWMALAVNAVHWFNPMAYFLCAGISDVCEGCCDAAVTRNMSDEERKNYMKTILELAG